MNELPFLHISFSEKNNNSTEIERSLKSTGEKKRSSTGNDEGNQINDSTTEPITRLNKELSQISHITEYHIRTLECAFGWLRADRICIECIWKRHRRYTPTNHWLLDAWCRSRRACSFASLVSYAKTLFECRAEFLIGLHVTKRIYVAQQSCCEEECRFITKRKSHECINTLIVIVMQTT